MIHPLVRNVIGKPVLAWRRRELTRFLALLPRTHAVQTDKLAGLLAAMRGSAFARDFGLDARMAPDELRRALPIAGFERVAPYVARLAAGEEAALFAPGTKVLMLALTSGSTAAAKHIPVTAASFAEYRRSWTVWGCGVAAAHPDVPFGGVLNLASGWRTATTAGGLAVGSISGLLVDAMHGTLRLTNVVPPAVAAVPGAEARWYLALRLALARPDTMMVTTANPSTLVAFARQLDADKEHLVRDLRDGTLRHAAAYPRAVLDVLGGTLGRKHPGRAAELERLAGATLTPRAAWPRLELLGVWTGGTLAPYLKMLPELYGNTALRDHGLSASEGRMTIPLADGEAHGVLNVDGAFFEFIPESAYGAANPETLLAHELEAGQRYVLVVTTSGGLVRYDMADVVECRGFLDGAPRLAFLNKGAHFASLTGEKVSAYQAVEAARRAFDDRGFRALEFVVAPRFGDPARYTLILERRDAPPPAAAAALAAALDRRLAEGNVEYAEKRKSGRLGPVALATVPDGAFAARRVARIAKGGGALEQYKHPFLVPDLSLEPELGSLDP